MGKKYLTEEEVWKKVIDKTGWKLKHITKSLKIFGSDKAPDFFEYIGNAGADKIYVCCECKGSKKDIKEAINDIEKYKSIIQKSLKKVVYIAYNGIDIKVFKNDIELNDTELNDPKYYAHLFDEPLNITEIKKLTRKINTFLHKNINLTDVFQRMIFVSSALIVISNGGVLLSDSFKSLKSSVYSKLEEELKIKKNNENKTQLETNNKLEILLEEFNKIDANAPYNEKISELVDSLNELGAMINNSAWNGEDVAATFFREFTSRKDKVDNGQVFTPEHICHFMYRLLDCKYGDKILDAACGSGTFLTTSMAEMLKECTSDEQRKIVYTKSLYGIEYDRRIFAVACANMLIHKDGKSNICQGDSTTDEICDFVKKNRITKVLMNPPFEDPTCISIVDNILRTLNKNTLSAFILPDNKLTTNKHGDKILNHSTLLAIIKLPKKIFPVSITTSIFIFKAGTKHDWNKKILTMHLEDDGFQTIVNCGRHDIDGRWKEIENNYISLYNKYIKNQNLTPREEFIKWNVNKLEYEVNKKVSPLCKNDFEHAVLQWIVNFKTTNIINKIKIDDLYCLFYDAINSRKNNEKLKQDLELSKLNDIIIQRSNKKEIDKNFQDVNFKDVFEYIGKGNEKTATSKRGDIPLIVAKNNNNGIGKYITPISKIFPAKCLTVVSQGDGGSGFVFYQPYKFSTTSSVHVFKCKFDKLNDKSGLFISTILTKYWSSKYNRQHPLSLQKIQNEKIKLPVNSVGEIDWEWIQQFMNKLNYSNLI